MKPRHCKLHICNCSPSLTGTPEGGSELHCANAATSRLMAWKLAGPTVVHLNGKSRIPPSPYKRQKNGKTSKRNLGNFFGARRRLVGPGDFSGLNLFRQFTSNFSATAIRQTFQEKLTIVFNLRRTTFCHFDCRSLSVHYYANYQVVNSRRGFRRRTRHPLHRRRGTCSRTSQDDSGEIGG